MNADPFIAALTVVLRERLLDILTGDTEHILQHISSFDRRLLPLFGDEPLNQTGNWQAVAAYTEALAWVSLRAGDNGNNCTDGENQIMLPRASSVSLNPANNDQSIFVANINPDLDIAAWPGVQRFFHDAQTGEELDPDFLEELIDRIRVAVRAFEISEAQDIDYRDAFPDGCGTVAFRDPTNPVRIMVVARLDYLPVSLPIRELLMPLPAITLTEEQVETYKANDEDCPICLEAYSIDTPIARTRCNHVFHHECLHIVRQTQLTADGTDASCPMCRRKLVTEWEHSDEE